MVHISFGASTSIDIVDTEFSPEPFGAGVLLGSAGFFCSAWFFQSELDVSHAESQGGASRYLCTFWWGSTSSYLTDHEIGLKILALSCSLFFHFRSYSCWLVANMITHALVALSLLGLTVTESTVALFLPGFDS